jgi:DNA polymerase
MTENDKALSKIGEEVLLLSGNELTNYRRSEGNLPVIGEGNTNANIVFVGEAPGRNEAKSGRPFCGAAGKILDDLLLSVSLSRDNIYITNIVKDRPPKNRDPLKEEIEIYGPYLVRQLDIIKPKVVVPLGRHAMEYVFKMYGIEDESEVISLAHGKVFSVKQVHIVPLYHPAAAIYNRKLIPTLKKDFLLLKKYI